jgi:hypothetical protein
MRDTTYIGSPKIDNSLVGKGRHQPWPLFYAGYFQCPFVYPFQHQRNLYNSKSI